MQFSNAIFAISLIFAGNAISAEASSRSALRERVLALGDVRKCSDMPKGEHCNHPGSGCSMVDAAFIYTGCTGDVGYPEHYTNERCNNIYGTDCTFGDGWYCNDGKDVGDMLCDDAIIWTGCTGTGQLVDYDNDTFSNGDTNNSAGPYWMCNYVPE